MVIYKSYRIWHQWQHQTRANSQPAWNARGIMPWNVICWITTWISLLGQRKISWRLPCPIAIGIPPTWSSLWSQQWIWNVAVNSHWSQKQQRRKLCQYQEKHSRYCQYNWPDACIGQFSAIICGTKRKKQGQANEYSASNDAVESAFAPDTPNALMERMIEKRSGN